ncbi:MULTISPECIES: DUF859 family phage minor structural protein [unclassified Granulicatella]|uniref:DUF859 family phage minor structural protein n=1 Tax=unclassified Granulicatella TaxID=2630493 RepID=UPI00066E9EA4|nr:MULTISPECIES: DUF859 family phage minor structural protein [unclassified Granulicatella]
MGIKYFNGNWHVYTKYEVILLSQNNPENYSDVAIDLWIGNDSGGYRIEFDPTYGAYLGVQFAGDTQYVKVRDLFIAGSEKYLGRLKFRVYHDDDGQATRTITIWSGSTSGITYDGWYVGDLYTSFTETFEKIPRMSTIASVEGKRALGEELTINIERKVDNFTHQVWYKVWGSDWIDLGKNIGTSVKFTPSPENARLNVNVVSSTFDICVRTFDGESQIGRDEYSNGWYIGLPANTQPKLQTIELTDKAKATKDIVGKNTFVQTFSEMVCQFQGMEGTYGSTIKNFYAEVVDQKMSITSNGATFQFFKNYGDFQVQAYVIDSRGLKSNIVTVPIKVLQYFAPMLTFEAVRGGGDQQTIVVRRTAKIAPLIIDGVQKNPMRLKFKVKPAYDGYFTENAGGGIDSRVINSVTNSNADLFGTFSADKAWIVEGTISDAYASFTFTAPIVGPEELVQCRTPKGTGFGKVWERGTIDAKGDIYSHNELVQVGRLTQINGKSIKMTGSANNLMKTGLFYSHGMSDLPSNLTGSQLYGYIQVNTHPTDENYVMQTYTPYDANVIYMRRKTPITGWQPWVIFTPSGSVSEWKTATLQRGWKPYQGERNVQYTKQVDGTVLIRGSCQGGDGSAGTLFYLPDGYKPSMTVYFVGIAGSGTPFYGGINTHGTVYTSQNVRNNWLCLDGISFKID